jgi:peptide/nickel transport system substrate-binding protein
MSRTRRRPRPGRLFRIAATVPVALLSLASGCSQGAGSPAGGGTLTAVISADPGNLDPQRSVIDTDTQVAAFAYDRLVMIAADGSIESNLATAWSANSAGTQYTFKLREAVTCSDGSTLTPATVAANLDYVGNPKNASPLLGTALPAGTTATADAAADTVTATLPGPAPFFLSGLALLPIVCQKGIDDRATLAHATDGTGPYTLTGAQPGDRYTYTLRKGYTWGPGGASSAVAGMPATVVLEVVADETTATNLLLNGGAQIAAVSGADRTRLSGAGLFHVGTTELSGELFFNQAAGEPGVDPTVRRALAMGLNLPQVGAVLTGGAGTPAQGLVAGSPAPCPTGTVHGNVPGYDQSQAAVLLSQDGWSVGPGGVREKNGKQLAITLLYATGFGDSGPATELMQQELELLGVHVTLEGRSSSQLSGIMFGTGAWDLALVPIAATDPSQLVPYLSGPTPPNGDNFAHLDDPGYLGAVAQAETHPGSTGCALWNEGEVSLLRAVDVLPFEDNVIETWGKSATFATLDSVILPTSLRLVG